MSLSRNSQTDTDVVFGRKRAGKVIGGVVAYGWVLNPGAARVWYRGPRMGQDSYQTRQAFSGYIGWPLWQPKALAKPSKFCTLPLVRHLPGEWGSVKASCRADCSV